MENVAIGPKHLGRQIRKNEKFRLKNVQIIINEIIEKRSEHSKHVFIDSCVLHLDMLNDWNIIKLLEIFYKKAGWPNAHWDSERVGFRLTA